MHYVCSDIHGQIGLYRKMMEEIDLKPEDTLYIIGDVIDRGPDSIGILQDIMKRENVELFVGNHEMMMIDYFHESPYKDSWFCSNNGGRKTYNQFMKLSEEEQEKVFFYIKDAWIQKYIEVDGEKYALHHSYFLPLRVGEDVRYNDENSWQSKFDAVWNSPYRFWEYADPKEYDDGYIHIIGHVPVQTLQKVQPPHYNDKLGKRLINIDGGCALLSHGYDGGLFCMSLEKDENGRRKEFWFQPKK